MALRASVPSRVRGRLAWALPLVSAVALMLGACGKETANEPAAAPRPVRTITAAKGDVGETVVLTGQILAEKEVSLAFRIGGRILKRLGNVGDRVEPDKVLATLDPVDELNALRSATAALSAAEGQLLEAGNNFDRQSHLMERGFTTRVNYDQARQTRQTAQARVDDARAQLDQAQDRVSFTELESTVTGAITAANAEAGEVVQPGQSIFQVARDDGRDAVFDVPAQVLRAAPPDATITVTLTDDPSVTAKAAGADGRSAGRSRHAHIPRPNEPDRSPRGHAARRDGHGPSGTGRRPGHRDPGKRAH